MEKFAITGELLLTADIKDTLKSVKSQLEKADVKLSISLNDSNITREIQALKKRLLNNNIYIGVRLRQEEIKNVYKEIRTLKNSIEGKPITASVGLNIKSLQDDIKIAYKEIRTLRNSLTTPITTGVSVNSTSVQKDIKNIYKELNFLRNSFKSPLDLFVNIDNDQKIKDVLNTLGKIRSKKVVLDFVLKTDSFDKFDLFKSNVKSLSDVISSFNLTGFRDINKTAGTLVTNLKRLSNLSNKKYSFDFSIRDINKVEKLEKYINGVAAAFDKASINSGRFNANLLRTSDIINILRNNLSLLDFSPINAAAKTIEKLNNPKAVENQKKVTQAIRESGSAIYELGVQSGETLKRFGAYTIVTATFFRLSFALRNAVSEFVEFDKELTKIRQVTGQSLDTTRLLGNEVGRLATTYGVSSNSILNTSLVLAQAGFSATETKEALEALTKTEIAPTFDDINNTVEGAIAAMAQFGIKTKDLEKELSSINAVSAAFAVESEDITTAIQKTGGAFAGAGGNVHELRGIFSSARATTRESADTIATGLRTITTRLQRVRTADFLRDLGINIRFSAEEARKFGKTEGDFVGPYEALKRIAEATKELSGADPRFAQITEELGGFRQINKVIPILKNFTIAEEALRVSIQGTDSLTKDALVAQESYANQLEKVRQEFLLLIRTLAEDESIKKLITDLLDLTKAGLRVAQTFKNIVPLLGAFAGIKTVGFLREYLPGIKDSVLSRNSGGLIPGSGPNRDTVPAMLTKGEYVLNRKAVKKVGVNSLNRLNYGFETFNQGGPVGGSTYGKLLAGGIGIGLASQLGLVSSLEKADESIQKFVNTILGLTTEIAAGLFIIKNSNGVFDTIEDFSKRINTRTKPSIGGPPATFVKNESLSKIAKEEAKLLADKNALNRVESAITQNELKKNKRAISINKLDPASLSQRTEQGLFNLIPKDIQNLFKQGGVTREVVDDLGNIPSAFAGDSKLKAGGRYDSSKRVVQVLSQAGFNQTKSNKRASVFFHEYGHAFDELMGFVRDDAEFVKAYKRDIEKLTKAQRKEFEYFLQSKTQNKRYSRGEIVAQSFADVVAGNTSSRFSQAFPRSSKFIQQLIGQTPIEQQKLVRQQKIERFNKSIQGLSTITGFGGSIGQQAFQLGELEGKAFRNEEIQRRRDLYQYAIDRNFTLAGPSGPRKPPRRNFFGNFFGGPPNPPSQFGGSLSSRFNPKKLIKGGIQNAAAISLIGGLVGNAAGGLFQDFSKPTQTGGNKLGFSAGGALSSAATGASFAGFAGSLFGPLGAAVGAIGGGLVGAVYGAVTSLGEFDKQLQVIDVDKINERFSSIFDRVASGSTNFRTIAPEIESGLKDLQKILQNTSDQTVIADTTSVIKNNAVNLRNFYEDIARSSISFENFNKKTNIGSQRFLSSILNIPFSEFQKEIKDVIKASNRQALFVSRSNSAVNEFTNRIKSLSLFTSAFKEASLSVNTFSNNLESFSLGSGGTTRTENTVSSRLNDLKSVVDTEGLKNEINNFTGQFGSIGKVLGQSVAASIDAKSIIPNILLELKNTEALGPEGGLEVRFANLVTKAFQDISGNDSLNPSQVNTLNILSSQFQQLLGEDLKDSNFFKALDEDFGKVVNDFSNKLEQVPSGIAESFEIANSRLNRFSEDLEKTRVLNAKLREGRASQFDNIGTLIQSRATFNNTDPSSRLLANERSRTQFLTEGRSVQELINTIRFNQQRVQSTSFALDNTNNIQQQIQLRTALETQRVSIEKASTSLEYLAKSTNQLTILQSKLSTAQEKRLVRRNFAEDLAFADPAERRRLTRVAESANTVARTSRLSSIPRSIIADVRSFLQTNFNNIIGTSGLKGKDVLDNIIKNDPNLTPAQKASVAPGKDEINIQKQIEDQISKQIAAQDALNTILEKDRLDFSKSIRSDMDTFLNNLFNIISKTQTADIESQIASRTSDLNTAITNRRNLQSFNTRFGDNAVVNAEEIKKNAEIFNQLSSTKTIIPSILGRVDESRREAFGGGNTTLKGFFKPDISVSEFNKIIGNLIKDLDQNQQQRVISEFSKNNIGRDFENDTVNINKGFDVFKNTLEAIATETSGKLSEAQNRRQELISNVGGSQNYNNILKNANEISKLSKQFPKDITIGQLNNEIRNLNIEIRNLRSGLPNKGMPIRRNSGGIVPGFGNTDSVPALLTPGEFVLNKEAVKRAGISNIFKLNKMKTGGFVGRASKKQIYDYAKQNNIPQSIINLLDQKGTSIDVADSIVDIDQNLRFQQPRGFPEGFSFNDIKGLYRSGENRILIKNTSSSEVLTHEIGHAFDYLNNRISDSKEYMIAYAKDYSKLNQEQRDKYRYFLQRGEAGRRESFAGIFDSITRRTSAYNDAFPETTKFVTGAIKEFEVNTFRQAFEDIRALRNVDNPDWKALLTKIRSVRDQVTSSLIKDDPRSQTFLSQLNTAEKLYQNKLSNPIRRNYGGVVPGFGSSDSVPALLTPGEFVMNKQAVKSYGLETMRKINSGSKRYNNGGLVQSNQGAVSLEYINKFNLAINQLAIQVQNIKDAFATIPTEISMNGTHRLDVYINGAQAFSSMQAEFANLVTAEIKKSINKLIKTKFPNIGQFDG